MSVWLSIYCITGNFRTHLIFVRFRTPLILYENLYELIYAPLLYMYAVHSLSCRSSCTKISTVRKACYWVCTKFFMYENLLLYSIYTSIYLQHDGKCLYVAASPSLLYRLCFVRACQNSLLYSAYLSMTGCFNLSCPVVWWCTSWLVSTLLVFVCLVSRSVRSLGDTRKQQEAQRAIADALKLRQK